MNTRSLGVLLVTCLAWSTACAQEPGPDLTDLPGWIHAALTGDPEPKAAKSIIKPMHTNAFIGTWTLRDKYGRRIHYWGDQHRLIFREMRDTVTTARITVVDLQSNVKVKMSPSKEMTHITLEDLKLEQAGYFYELFNDTVIATGRTENVMGQTCEVLLGANSNKDTTTYYRTTVHPKLFADLKVWAVWLCREGNLEYLSAFSDRNAGSSLRVKWKNQGYSTTAGDWYFEEITPGKQPMPVLPWRPNRIIEERFLFTNNARLGRLPDWMRERINRLPAVKPLVQSTPPAVDRGLPDNRFVGNFTAQTMTRYIDEHKDTTEQYANYTYWADERRAVISVDAPHEKGITLYMVDLDNDVAVAAYNEGHSYVIPRLYIGTLERVGIPELMEGIGIELVPMARYRTILGERCELHVSMERWAGHYWYPEHPTPNPVLDMVRWMQPGYIQSHHMKHFEDLLAFAAKGRPMPYAVNGTYLTSFKPGKAPPPAMDLSNYRVMDERFRDFEQERQEYERDKARQQAISIDHWDDVVVPVDEGDSTPKETEPVIEEAPLLKEAPLEPPPMISVPR
ncbi:MAG TPA: hypothetical protein PLL25_07240 [Flavobacteriales bacterium]|nr:hypothetical protein [Flavobacteriales bacterium]